MPAPKRPDQQSILDQLAPYVQPKQVNNNVGIGRYYNSAELLLRSVEVSRLSHGPDALRHIYVYLMRYASLIVETIPRHRDFRAEDTKYKRLRGRLANGLMDELNSAKTALKLQTGGLPRRGATSHKRDAGAVQTSLSALPTLNWSQLTQYASSLSGDSGGDGFDSLGSGGGNGHAAAAAPYSSSGALDLLSGNATPSAPPPPGQRQPQQQNLLPFDPRALGGGAGSLPAASHEVQQRHALLPSAQQRRRPSAPAPAAQRPLYPDFDASPVSPINYGTTPASPSQANGSSRPPATGQPSLMDAAPSQPPGLQQAPQPSAQLTADLQQQVASNVKPQLELQLGPQEMQVDRVLPEADGTCCAPQHPPSPLEKDFEGLRDVNVSVSLMEDFMRLCIANTQRNIETIGLLGGRLSKNGTSFNIDTLIIPKQKGETDRVEMLKEEEMWDIFFQDGQEAQQSLFPVGWIHTHPAFDCFLSSVDIHNQYGYQVMLEEAVAIVMSPRDSQNRKCGIFRLTTPGGMGLIKDCSQTGFHTHGPTSTGQKIYELCGHVYINPKVPHTVVDLRTK